MFLLKRLSQRRIWRQVALERLSEPLHLNLASMFVAAFGSLRMKIFYDLCVRPQHAYGLLNAADAAIEGGHKRTTVIEFGVADGAGLINICELGKRITKTTGVQFDVVGFDGGSGMPPYRDYRDHPEMYQPGWYRMQDPEALRRALPANASLHIGDIAETVAQYVAEHDRKSPIGFVSVDVDYYWSAAEALRFLTGDPLHYLPRIAMYFDDVGHPWHNPWCGELLAINEFNATNDYRKISRINFLRETRLFKNASWIRKMYFCHVFDHPERLERLRNYGQVDLGNPYLGLERREGVQVRPPAPLNRARRGHISGEAPSCATHGSAARSKTSCTRPLLPMPPLHRHE